MYKRKYKDFTFNIYSNGDIINLEILYTPGYTLVDVYGVNGTIFKQNGKFIYVYKENYNLLDFFSVGILVFLGFLYIIALYFCGIKETSIFAYMLIIALLIILSLLYMRNRKLKIIHDFILNKMK